MTSPFKLPQDGVLGWNNVGTGLMVVLVLIGIVMSNVVVIPKKKLEENKYVPDCIIKMLYKCHIPCNKNGSCQMLNEYRGGNYWLGHESPDCTLTGWEISHVIVHIFLGFFYNIYISQSISVGFEIYEHMGYNCGSLLELGHNLFGFFIGYALRVATGYKNI
jgi:hypothetical protein